MSSQNSDSSTRVFAPNFLTIHKKQDLLKNLIDLHAVLASVTQDPSDRPRGLQLIANQIVETRLMNHADRDIRLLAACCSVDILRIYAPEAPYGDSELLRIFKVITNQIQGLSTSDISKGSGSKILYILSSLSIVKSCVVLVVLTKSNVPGAYELLLEFFDALISSLNPDHPAEVGTHMGSILQACIEEMDTVEQDVMDIILQPLLPHNKADSPTAYTLCQSVLRRTSNHLDSFISNFINTHIMSTLPKDSSSFNINDVHASTAFDESIFALIYEIHKITPNLLLRILPNICIQLSLEDETLRLKTVKLLGKLFSSPYADYGIQFHKNFKDFLSRFNDISVNIRLEMISCGLLILRKKPSLRDVIEDNISKKLRDIDGDVRFSAAKSLLDLANEDIYLLKPSSYQELGERVKDKKIDIRHLCLIGLARVYSKYLAPLFHPIKENNMIRTSTEYFGEFDRLGFLPKCVVNCWGYPDMPTRMCILEILQEQLLPLTFIDKSNSMNITNDDESHAEESTQSGSRSDTVDSQRAAALFTMFKTMNATERSIFGGILATKARIYNEVEKFLDCRSRVQSGKVVDSPRSIDEELRLRAHSLMNVLAPTDKKSLIFDKMLAVKDKHIFRLLQKSLDPCLNLTQLLEARNDMTSRLQSKSSLGEYFNNVFNFSCFGIVNLPSTRSLLIYGRYCVTHDEESDEDGSVLIELLQLISKNSAPVFQGLASDINSFLTLCSQEENNSATLGCLRAIKNAANSIAKSDKEAANHLCDNICNLGFKSSLLTTYEVYFESAAALANAGIDSPVASILKSLTSDKKMNPTNKKLPLELFALASLIRHCPDIALKSCKLSRILETLRSDIFPHSDSKLVGAGGMKIWTSICLATEKAADSSSVISAAAAELLENLFTTIVNAGASFCDLIFNDVSDQIFIRETAAICVFYLLRLKQVDRGLTVTQWHNLGWSLLDSNSSTRKVLAFELNTLIQTQIVHPKILALPCLLATDDLLFSSAENALTFAIHRLRRTHQIVCDRILDAEDEKVIKLAADNMPETVLPYVLHILSHHPDFPASAEIDDEQDRLRMKAVMKSLNLMLSVLLDTNSAENLSYLFKQVNIISRFYTDRVDNGNLGLDFVTRLTRKLLNDKIRSAENIQSYPGDISLPMDLYELCSEEDRVDGSETEKAVEQALNIIGKSRPVCKKRNAMERIIVSAKKTKKTKADIKIKRNSRQKISTISFDDDSNESDREIGRLAAHPTRSGRLIKSVKYTEIDEDESEIQKWDDNAGKGKRATKTSTSKISSKNDQENILCIDSSSKRKQKMMDILDPESSEDDLFGEKQEKKRVLKERENKGQKL